MSPNQASDRISILWKRLQNTSALVRSLTLIVVYLVVGIGLEEVADYFGSPLKVEPWNPAAGWHVGLIFGFGLRYIPVLFIAPFLENLQQGNSLVYGTVSGICTAVFYGAASAILLYKLDFNPRLTRSRDVVKFATVFAFASLIFAIGEMGTLSALGEIESNQWFTKTMHEWAGEATGITMFTPLLLTLWRKFPRMDKYLTLQATPPEINFSLPKLEDAKKWLGLIFATILFTWAASGGIRSQGLDYTYFTFVPLVFTCAWKGFESATAIILLINVTSVIFVGKNANNTNTDTLALQFGLMTVTYTGLLLGAFVSARNRESNKSKNLEEELRYDATHDSLTGLYNRAWFLDRLDQICDQANQNEDHSFALLFLDLDRFKTVNDRLGHAAGDSLLVKVVQKLQECLPESASIARLGGDEFTVLLEELSNMSQVSQIAETVCRELGQTYTVDNYEIFISVSIGVAVNFGDRQQPADLIRDADIALYEAKARGKSQYVIFDNQMYDRAIVRAQLEQDLRQAINEL